MDVRTRGATLRALVVALALGTAAASASAACPEESPVLALVGGNYGVFADFTGDGRPEAFASAGNCDICTTFYATVNPGGSTPRLDVLAQAATLRYGVSIVGAGDLDARNGRDVVVLNKPDELLHVYLNRGDGTFDLQPAIPLGFDPAWRVNVLADLDIDGLPDIVVAGMDGILRIFWNDAGALAAPVLLAVGTNPTDIRVHDIACDGRPDLIVSDGTAVDFGIACNVGGRAFGPDSRWWVGAPQGAIAMGDFNGDGADDVAAASSADDEVRVLHGDGAGSFGAPVVTTLDFGVTGLVAGDLDNDGDWDLLAQSGLEVVLLADGAGRFVPGSAMQGTDEADLIDFDGDGDLDIVGGAGVNRGLWVGVNPGDAAFTPWRATPLAERAGALATGDFDRDGWTDVAVVTGAAGGDRRIGILLGRGDGSLGPETTVATTFFPRSVAVGDLDGVNGPDLAMAGSGTSVSLTRPDGSPGAPTLQGPTDIGGGDLVAIAEMDGRPGLDIVAEHGATVVVLGNDGAGAFTEIARPPLGRSIDGLGVADFDGDGDADVAVVNGWSATLALLFNSGSGDLPTMTEIPLSVDRTSVYAGSGEVETLDADGDGDIDIIIKARGVGPPRDPIFVLANAGDGTFSVLQVLENAAIGAPLAAGDLDLVGGVDLVQLDRWSFTQGHGAQVLVNGGDGILRSPIRVPFPSAVGSGETITIADMDHAGGPEIVAVLDSLPWLIHRSVCFESVDLGRSARLTSLTPVAPPLLSVLRPSGGLDFVGPDGVGAPGEGDDDDLYIVGFAPGSTDPDPFVDPARSPLVFYQASIPDATLRVRKDVTGRIRITF